MASFDSSPQLRTQEIPLNVEDLRRETQPPIPVGLSARNGERINVELPQTLSANNAELLKLLDQSNGSDASKRLIDALRQYNSDGDPKVALQRADAGFRSAISTADQEKLNVVQDAAQFSQVPPEQVAQQMRQVAATDLQLSQAIFNSPKPDGFAGNTDQWHKKLKDWVDAWKHDDVNDHSYAGLEADLKQDPDVWNAAQAYRGAVNAEPMKDIRGLMGRYATATHDSVITRLAYADALRAAGQEMPAWRQYREAMQMLGKKVPELPPGMVAA